MPDPYEVLQVHAHAETEVIRAAYRALARKYHPDHGGDPARMSALNDAWDVIGDPVRRAAYDAARAGSNGQRPVETPIRPETGAQWAPGTSAPTAADVPHGGGPTHAGPPPGRPSGTVLDFGRYSGWSLGEIARHDMDYLEWLLRATFGRRLRAEIEALLVQSRGPGAAARSPLGQGWNTRR